MDLHCRTGQEIPIEYRSPAKVLYQTGPFSPASADEANEGEEEITADSDKNEKRTASAATTTTTAASTRTTKPRTITTIRVAAPHSTAENPAFDVTPESLISGIVTEHGILRPPYAESIRAVCCAMRVPGGATAPTSSQNHSGASLLMNRNRTRTTTLRRTHAHTHSITQARREFQFLGLVIRSFVRLEWVVVVVVVVVGFVLQTLFLYRRTTLEHVDSPTPHGTTSLDVVAVAVAVVIVVVQCSGCLEYLALECSQGWQAALSVASSPHYCMGCCGCCFQLSPSQLDCYGCSLE